MYVVFIGSHGLLLDTIPPPIIPCIQLNKKFTKQCEKGITLTHPLQTLMKAYRTKHVFMLYAATRKIINIARSFSYGH